LKSPVFPSSLQSPMRLPFNLHLRARRHLAQRRWIGCPGVKSGARQRRKKSAFLLHRSPSLVTSSPFYLHLRLVP
jgi:hypothetical protein